MTSTTFEDAVKKDRTILPQEFQEGLFCEDFEFRCGGQCENVAALTRTRQPAVSTWLLCQDPCVAGCSPACHLP